MKQNKRMTTMVTLLCALIVLFVGYKVAASMNAAKEAKEAAEEEAKNATIMIADYTYSDTTELSYTHKGEETVSLSVYNESYWILPDNLDYPVEQTKPTYMANALASMGAISRVNLDGADTEAFGLDDPEWTFSITYNGTDTHTYRLGNYNAFSDGYYFQEDGKEDVYLILGTLLDYFDYTLYDLADYGTFPVISSDEFKSVAITMADETVTLTGDDICTSFLVLANVLQPSQYLEYQQTEELLAKYGLTKPAANVTYTYAETYTVTDSEGATSDSTFEQELLFSINIGDDFEKDGETYTAYTVDGYDFIYYMPVSTGESMLSYFAANQ